MDSWLCVVMRFHVFCLLLYSLPGDESTQPVIHLFNNTEDCLVSGQTFMLTGQLDVTGVKLEEWQTFLEVEVQGPFFGEYRQLCKIIVQPHLCHQQNSRCFCQRKKGSKFYIVIIEKADETLDSNTIRLTWIRNDGKVKLSSNVQKIPQVADRVQEELEVLGAKNMKNLIAGPCIVLKELHDFLDMRYCVRNLVSDYKIQVYIESWVIFSKNKECRDFTIQPQDQEVILNYEEYSACHRQKETICHIRENCQDQLSRSIESSLPVQLRVNDELVEVESNTCHMLLVEGTKVNLTFCVLGNKFPFRLELTMGKIKVDRLSQIHCLSVAHTPMVKTFQSPYLMSLTDYCNYTSSFKCQVNLLQESANLFRLVTSNSQEPDKWKSKINDTAAITKRRERGWIVFHFVVFLGVLSIASLSVAYFVRSKPPSSSKVARTSSILLGGKISGMDRGYDERDTLYNMMPEVKGSCSGEGEDSDSDSSSSSGTSRISYHPGQQKGSGSPSLAHSQAV